MPKAIVALVAIAMSAACTESRGPTFDDPAGRQGAQVSAPTTRPDISGTITRLTPGDSVRRPAGGGDPNSASSCPPTCTPTGTPMRSVLVEEVPGSTGGDEKSSITVPAAARVLRRSGDALSVVGFDYLRVGQRVEAWFDGPVAESYPTLSTARVIIVLE